MSPPPARGDRHALTAESIQSVSKRFGIDSQALRRHKANHLARRVAEVRQVVQAALEVQTVNIVADLTHALGLANSGVTWALSEGDVRGYAAMLGRMLDILTLFEPRLKTVEPWDDLLMRPIQHGRRGRR